jgi:hypothetical protein
MAALERSLAAGLKNGLAFGCTAQLGRQTCYGGLTGVVSDAASRADSQRPV